MSAGPFTVRQGWLDEVGRDLLALGSAVFYVLVLGRALVGPFWDLVVPLVAIGAVLLAASPVLRDVDLYFTRAVVVAVLVSRHYGDLVFAAFSAVALVLMVAFAVRLGRSTPAIAKGLALGAVASAIGWVLAAAAE